MTPNFYLRPMLTLRSAPRFSRLIWLLVAGVFVADLLLPRHFDIVFAYLLAHFLAISFREKSDVLLLAVVTTTLTVVGAAFKQHELPLEQILLERLPPIVSFWAAAFFVISFIALREVEELERGRFEALFHFAANGILLANREGKIVLANPAAEAIFGYEKGELLGKSVEMLIPTRLAKRHEAYRQDFHHAFAARVE